jgi:very-short-patch-repair endonuclease
VERDRFFEEKGLKVIHIPNEAALKYSNIIAEIIAFFTR